jgi:hypothetical protein
MRDRVERLPALHGRGPVPAPVGAEERVALGVESGERLRAGEVCDVIAPLPILRLVVDHTIGDFYLAS